MAVMGSKGDLGCMTRQCDSSRFGSAPWTCQAGGRPLPDASHPALSTERDRAGRGGRPRTTKSRMDAGEDPSVIVLRYVFDITLSGVCGRKVESDWAGAGRKGSGRLPVDRSPDMCLCSDRRRSRWRRKCDPRMVLQV
jgi:hypothetical protein